MNLYDFCVNKGFLDLIEAWDDEKPMQEVALRSHKKYQLRCPKCGTVKIQTLGSLVNLPKYKFHCIRCNSFGKWCEDNGSVWLEHWDYEKNKVSPYEIDHCVGKSYYFKCERNLHESELTRIADITHDGFKYRCKKCNSFAQWCIDNGETELLNRWDEEKNNMTAYQVSYSSGKKYYFKCPTGKHESEAKPLCNIVKQEGSRCCQQCNSFAQICIEKFGEDYFNDIWCDNNTVNPYKISRRCNKKVWLNCTENKSHPPFLMTCANYMRGERCPVCRVENTTSKLQNKVMNYINGKKEYTLIHEEKCSLNPISPITNMPLRYDNEIVELKIIIEVMGIQHYKISNFTKKNAERRGMTLEEYFKYCQWIDEFKKQFVLDNGYFYLAIPYWTEETEEYKELIDNAIQTQIIKLQTSP